MEDYTSTNDHLETAELYQKLYPESPEVDISEQLCTFFKDAQDPMGSYTGTSLWGDAYPEQDVDDL